MKGVLEGPAKCLTRNGVLVWNRFISHQSAHSMNMFLRNITLFTFCGCHEEMKELPSGTCQVTLTLYFGVYHWNERMAHVHASSVNIIFYLLNALSNKHKKKLTQKNRTCAVDFSRTRAHSLDVKIELATFNLLSGRSTYRCWQ